MNEQVTFGTCFQNGQGEITSEWPTALFGLADDPRIKGKATARPGRASDHGLWNERCPSCLARSSTPHRPPCCSSSVKLTHALAPLHLLVTSGLLAHSTFPQPALRSGLRSDVPSSERLLTRSQLAQPPSPTLGPVLYATPISSLSLLSRRWPVSQSQLTLCFCTAHELRLVFTFLNGWKRSFCDTLGVRSVPGQGSSHVLPARLLAQDFILAMERTFAPLPLCVTSVKKSQGTGLPRKAPISVMRPPPVETCLSRPPSSKPDTAIPTKWKTANSRTTKPFFQKQFN